MWAPHRGTEIRYGGQRDICKESFRSPGCLRGWEGRECNADTANSKSEGGVDLTVNRMQWRSWKKFIRTKEYSENREQREVKLGGGHGLHDPEVTGQETGWLMAAVVTVLKVKKLLEGHLWMNLVIYIFSNTKFCKMRNWKWVLLNNFQKKIKIKEKFMLYFCQVSGSCTLLNYYPRNPFQPGIYI